MGSSGATKTMPCASATAAAAAQPGGGREGGAGTERRDLDAPARAVEAPAVVGALQHARPRSARVSSGQWRCGQRSAKATTSPPERWSTQGSPSSVTPRGCSDTSAGSGHRVPATPQGGIGVGQQATHADTLEPAGAAVKAAEPRTDHWYGPSSSSRPAPDRGREWWRCGPHRWRARPTPDIPRTRSLTKGRGERTGEGDGTGALRPGPPVRALRPEAAALRPNHTALRRALRAVGGMTALLVVAQAWLIATVANDAFFHHGSVVLAAHPARPPAGGDRRARRPGLGHRTGGPPGLGLGQVGAAALGRRAHRRTGPGRSGPPGPRPPDRARHDRASTPSTAISPATCPSSSWP